MNNSLLIGIDGGGTHSTAVAAWPDGRVAAVAYGDGLNFHNVGVQKVHRRLEGMVSELYEKAGVSEGVTCVGMSALDGPADDETLKKFTAGLFKPGQLDLQSDAYVALMGFTQGDPGMIAICGTGSMLLLVDAQGRQLISGGWGYLLGDAGSGYSLAKEAVQAAIDEVEGLAPHTALTKQAFEFFGCAQPRQLIDFIYAPDFSPDRLAGFARVVLAEAQKGESVALDIVTRNMQKLARQAAQLFKQSPEACRIGLYGGIFAHSDLARKLFTDTLSQLKPGVEICDPTYPPELGAIIHLMKKQGCLCEESLKRLLSTYKEVRS